MTPQEAVIIVAEFDGWELNTFNQNPELKDHYWKECEGFCSLDDLVKKYLSLDTLVPVLEKLEADFCCSRTHTKEWSFEITWINDMPCDFGKWSKSAPEAAAIATAKAIQELEAKR